MQIKNIISLAVFLCCSLAVSGCTNAIVSDNLVSEPVMAQSAFQRDMSPEITAPELEMLIEGNNEFTFDLYEAIRDETQGNLFYSPYSISVALAMTYAGARGNTEKQMADTLHYTLPQEQLHAAFNALDLDLTTSTIDESGAENFKLAVANSLWGQIGYPFQSEFLDTIAENYGAGVRQVDFKDDRRREDARQAINQWVEKSTEGKIKELVNKGILTRDTRLILANAIYFKAEWERPFLNGTRDEEFALLDGSKVTVPMMSRRTTTRYAEDEHYQVLEVPYKGKRMTMVILLPSEGQFEAVEKLLDRQFVDQALNKLEPEDVKLYMPKFQYEIELSLAEILAAMGMSDAFDYKADFSGMDGGKFLHIAHIFHKAFVAVDEMGTEASASTAVIAEIESVPIKVRVDRPFIFFIRDIETDAILFAGRVVNPLEN